MADGISIEPVVHARWAASAALIALVPASRFVTGDIQDELTAIPYVSFNLDQRQKLTSNSGRMDDATLFFEVTADSYATGNAIAKQIVETFSGTFETDGVTLTCLKPSIPQREQSGLDRWIINLTIDAVAQCL
jgi:hypothetical protein